MEVLEFKIMDATFRIVSYQFVTHLFGFLVTVTSQTRNNNRLGQYLGLIILS